MVIEKYYQEKHYYSYDSISNHIDSHYRTTLLYQIIYLDGHNN